LRGSTRNQLWLFWEGATSSLFVVLAWRFVLDQSSRLLKHSMNFSLKGALKDPLGDYPGIDLKPKIGNGFVKFVPIFLVLPGF